MSLSDNSLNILIIFGVLYIGYIYVNKYKDYNKVKSSNKNIKSKEQQKDHFKEHFNMDKLYFEKRQILNDFGEKPQEAAKVIFTYGKERPIDKQYQKEQEKGMVLNTWYPNTWVEKIDEKGNLIMNSREKITGVKEDFVESKARFSYEFNTPRTLQMDGVIDPNETTEGKTLKEIYDNSFVDYKKTIPQMKKQNIPDNMIETKGASSLSYFSPDTWKYDNERLENGGEIVKGLFASDPATFDSVAVYEEL